MAGQRITIVIHSLTGGGSEHVAARMASHWAEAGRTVTLITLDSVASDRIAVSPKVHRVGLDVMRPSRGLLDAVRSNLHRIRDLKRAILHSQPDHVISLTDRMNVLTLLALRWTSLRGIVAERSDFRHQRIGRVWEWLRRRVYPTARCVVVQTATVADAIRPICGTAPVRVIPNCVWPIESSAESKSSTDSSPVSMPFEQADSGLNCLATQGVLEKRHAENPGLRWIVGVGRQSREKGFDRLIDAFADIAGDRPDWQLLLIGDGPEWKALEQQAQARGVLPRVIFAGWIEQPWRVVPADSVFVLPSRYEGFPNALLEAMSHGCTAIAFDCDSGPPEIITPDRDGILVPANDCRALAEAIRRVTGDESLRTALATSARESVTRFGPDRWFESWGVILTEIG